MNVGNMRRAWINKIIFNVLCCAGEQIVNLYSYFTVPKMFIS